MKIILIAWQLLANRPLSAWLNVTLLALGLGAAGFVALASERLDRAFSKDLQGIDAVVGAKGSPMQLILSGVLHIDVPPGNVRFSELQSLQKHPQVRAVIPVSLGDNFNGFRIVGTTADYAKLYEANLKSGQFFQQPMDAVLGAQVASAGGLGLGQSFAGNHGLGSGGEEHRAALYKVVGTLEACGCVLDRLILTPTESVWRVHDKELATDEADRRQIEAAMLGEREVTMGLVQYKSPLAAATFPRYVNQNTGMQAAAPAYEVSRLLRMLGAGSAVLQGFAAVLLGVAGLSVLIAMLNNLRERRADWASLRLLGASRAKLTGLLLTQSAMLALLASVLGVFFAIAAGAAAAAMAAQSGLGVASLSCNAQNAARCAGELAQQIAALWWLPLMALAVASIASVVPAWRLYRVDAQTLLSARRA